MPYDLEDHPDLKDAAWIRKANKLAKRDIRRQRRQARLRRHGGKVVSLIALVVIGAVLFGLHKAGKFGEVSLPEMKLPAAYHGVDTENPFARTPAEQWAEGEKGIVAPDQNPEYTALYEAARKAVMAGHLDRAVVVERNREPLLSMLAPDNRAHFEPIKDTVLWTSIKEGTTLLPVPVRVDGRMWADRDADGRPLVHTSYRFAYAFDPGDRKDSLVEQTELLAMVRSDADFVLTEEGLWVVKIDGYTYLMACKAAEEGYLAPAFTEKPKPAGKTSDRSTEEWFASNAPMPTDDGCK
ncbi:hypothetical protein [Lentzea sp. NPDC051838]|uniref:hypothetical protein n=1 Tax=Lentzea sp. NPDC051838 TaxID=3154849 RepID=UPI00342B113A